MRSLSRALFATTVVGAVALSASAADARWGYGYYASSYGDSYSPYVPRRSIPYDAGGPAYHHGQRDWDSSDDFQLQGR